MVLGRLRQKLISLTLKMYGPVLAIFRAKRDTKFVLGAKIQVNDHV